jgi:hypothetical protein
MKSVRKLYDHVIDERMKLHRLGNGLVYVHLSHVFFSRGRVTGIAECIYRQEQGYETGSK